jgi:hypothetical protein
MVFAENLKMAALILAASFEASHRHQMAALDIWGE